MHEYTTFPVPDFMVPAEWPFPTKKCIQKHQSYNAFKIYIPSKVSSRKKGPPQSPIAGKPTLKIGRNPISEGKSEHTIIFSEAKNVGFEGRIFP